MKHLFFACLLAGALLAACSGGGGGSAPSAAMPAAPLATGSAVPTAGPASGTRGTISLVIPTSKTSAANVRHAQFVSSATSSGVVAINGGSAASYDLSGTSPYCSGAPRTCTLPIGVPVGTTSVSVTLSLYDGATGTGRLLGSGTGSTTIAANATSFTVAVDVSPVVGNVTFSLSFYLTGLPRISDGYNESGANAGTATLTFTDPDGVTIPNTSTSTFLTPVALSVTDPSGTVSISPATVTNPTQTTATVSYTGGATIGASVTFNAATGATTVGTLVSKTSGYQTAFPIGLNTPGASKYPYGIAVGADGNLWFTEENNAAIGQMNTAGTVLQEYLVPSSGSSPQPYAIAAGPTGDPHLWYVEPYDSGGVNYGYVANVNTTGGATVAYYTGNAASVPTGVAPVGSNVWFANYGSNQLLVNTTLGATIGTVTVPGGTGPNDLILGPDGNVWVTGIQNGTILSYRTTSPYSNVIDVTVPAGAGSHPAEIIDGPDGALWFTEQLTSNIGRITTAGVLSEITGPHGQPYAMAVGSDGGIWYTANQSPTAIVRIDPISQQFVTYPLHTTQASWGLVTGPDGNLWATDFVGSAVVRIQP